MPTIFRQGPYRFFFYAGDYSEPPHVHMERENAKAKFWLTPVRLHSSSRFPSTELNRLHQIVEQNRLKFLEQWDEFFTD